MSCSPRTQDLPSGDLGLYCGDCQHKKVMRGSSQSASLHSLIVVVVVVIFYLGDMGEYTYIIVISVKHCWVQTPRAKLAVRSPFIHLSFRGKHVYKTQIYYLRCLV